MVIVENKIYLSLKDLENFGFSNEFLRTRSKEYRQGASKNYACIKAVDPDHSPNREVTLIRYDSIPEQTRLEKGIPPIEDLLQKKKQSELIRLTGLDTQAYQFYLKQSEIKDTKGATREHIAKSKAEQVHLLIAIASFKTREVTLRGFKNKDEFYLYAIDAINRIAEERGWYKWKCTTLAGFRKRVQPFIQLSKKNISPDEAYRSLINGRANNTNAEQTDFDQKALLVQIYAGLHKVDNSLGYDSNAKPNVEQTWDIYTRKASEMVSLGHWDPRCLISPSAVRYFLFNKKVMPMWYEARHGYQQYRSIYEHVIQRERASYANALWVIDGTPSHRYFQHGEKGRYFRFNLFPVLDAHSWCVLGFWLSETEDTESVLGALRSACMVSGCMPHQVLYDNSSAIQSYRAQEAIDKISIVSFPAKAGNAQAKIIENFFHLFNQDIQKFRPGYTANPFALTLTNRPNREALARKVKSKDLPLAENAIKQAIEDLTIWNNQPRKFLGGLSPLQAYRKSVEISRARQRTFANVIDVEAFWTLPGEHKKTRTFQDGKPKMVSTFKSQEYEFTNRGIEICINDNRFFYDIEDPAFRRLYTGQKFTLRYEPNPDRWTNRQQPDELLLYLQGAPLQWQGVHVAAVPKEKVPMAVADYQEGSASRIKELQGKKKVQRALVQQDFKEMIDRTLQNGTFTDVITDNAFDKRVLNDANEQIFNTIIEGNANWLSTKEPAPKQDEGDANNLNRLAGYDNPLPLDE